MLTATEQIEPGQWDEFNHPRFYSDSLEHDGCPRNKYCEFKVSAGNPPEQGCFMEHLGCPDTQARAECNIRPWNSSGSCLKGGYISDFARFLCLMNALKLDQSGRAGDRFMSYGADSQKYGRLFKSGIATQVIARLLELAMLLTFSIVFALLTLVRRLRCTDE